MPLQADHPAFITDRFGDTHMRIRGIRQQDLIAKFRRRLVVFASCLLAVLSWTGAAAAADSRPNILLIYTDDHSHRTVSCYDESWDWVKTPNIDRLASRGQQQRGRATCGQQQRGKANSRTSGNQA